MTHIINASAIILPLTGAVMSCLIINPLPSLYVIFRRASAGCSVNNWRTWNFLSNMSSIRHIPKEISAPPLVCIMMQQRMSSERVLSISLPSSSRLVPNFVFVETSPLISVGGTLVILALLRHASLCLNRSMRRNTKLPSSPSPMVHCHYCITSHKFDS